MPYRLTLLIALGCSILQFTKPVLTANLTDANKILCYACKGSTCDNIANHEDSIIACNKYTQICWAGFVDQQPYRTCASRYCTPSSVSLDSDIRIELCCHTNLCNSIPLSWSTWATWYRRGSTSSSGSSTASTTGVTTKRTTTTTTTPQVYIVNEIVDGKEENPSSFVESSEERDESFVSKSKVNTSNPASFGINWDRVTYGTGFGDRVTSINKLFLLFMPILLVFLF